MTLSGLVINIGIIALILSGLTIAVKKHKNYLMTFLQYFTGVLFVFSGWVKAIDPMGTAFKMEQYFAEFENTFSQTAFSFLSPLFPVLSSISIWFSVGMIIFEIILGIMLYLGIKPRLAAWLFFLLVLFFTILTGYTYLTGYVPSGVNFFDFNLWGNYKASNMKVTDCGCFGDFLKLEPKVSFFKDIFLLIPAILFLFKSKWMHVWVDTKYDNWILGLSTLGLLGYCLFNFVWNEPHIDFRPFRNGAEVAKQKELEEKAQASVKIISYKLKNLTDGKTIEVPYDQYMADKNYWEPKNYEVLDQVKSELTVPKSKISEFSITDFDGVEVNDLFLKNPKSVLLISSPKVKYTTKSFAINVQDSIFKSDTTFAADKSIVRINKSFMKIETKEVKKTDFIWPPSFLADLKSMKPLLDQASKDGTEVAIVIGGIIKEASEDLQKETGIKATYLTADDILLKTIMRSNPGLILWKNGVLVQKWHKNHLPTYESLKTNFIK
jgi:uncharacterized membrane protein YphA (DoxX/SURF4 family)